MCCLLGCLFYGRSYDEPEVVMIQPGIAQGYAIGPNGQPMMGPNGQPMMAGGQPGVVVVNQGGGYGCARRAPCGGGGGAGAASRVLSC